MILWLLWNVLVLNNAIWTVIKCKDNLVWFTISYLIFPVKTFKQSSSARFKSVTIKLGLPSFDLDWNCNWLQLYTYRVRPINATYSNFWSSQTRSLILFMRKGLNANFFLILQKISSHLGKRSEMIFLFVMEYLHLFMRN